MPSLNEAELKEKIKKNPIGVYMIYGEESFLVKTYTEKLVKASTDESFRDFNLHIFDGDEADLSEIYEKCTAVPMMAESKCVLVRDCVPDDEAFPLDSLETLLADNPEDNCLIFSYPSGRSGVRELNAFIKLFNKYGSTVNFGKKTEAELTKIVENGASKRGSAFEKGVADYFRKCVGDDLNLLGNELEKLCAYAGERIKKSDVDAVCTKSLSLKVFAMIKELTSGRFDSAFHMLSQLFSQREDEYMILGALVTQYSDIYRAKSAKKAGVPMSRLAECYGSYKSKGFALDNAARISSGLSFGQLAECMEILSQADTAMKNSSDDKKLILEQTLVKLARVGR